MNKDTLKFKNTLWSLSLKMSYNVLSELYSPPNFFEIHKYLSQLQITLISRSSSQSYQVVRIIEYSRKAQTQSHD